MVNTDSILAERLAVKKSKGRLRPERRAMGLILPDRLAASKSILIPPEGYAQLRAGGAYQRSELPSWTALLTHAYLGGSTILDIDVCRRNWGPQEERRLYFIVDGLQRASAAMRAGMAIPARLHVSESIDDEMLLFSVLNARRDPNGNHKVWANPGPACAALRALDSDEGHPAFGRIDWGRCHGRGPILSASLALKSFLIAAKGSSSEGIEAANGYFSKNVSLSTQLLRQWLKTVFECFGDEKPRNAEVLALAFVCGRIGMALNRAQTSKVKRIRWARIEAANAQDRSVLLRRRIAKAVGIKPDGETE